MIRFDDVHAIRCIAQAVGIQFVPSLHHCIAEYDTTDKLTGGVLFTDFWGGSVGMHVAGFRKNWGSRAIARWRGHWRPWGWLRPRSGHG